MNPEIVNQVLAQAPVVGIFVLFVLALFRLFLAELARRDRVFTETLERILKDHRESVETLTTGHNKSLARFGEMIKGFSRELTRLIALINANSKGVTHDK